MENNKITNVEIIFVKYPVKKRIKFPFAYHVISGFIFFKVKINNGLVGYGEPSPYLGNFYLISNLFKKYLLPLIEGQNVNSIDLDKIKKKINSKIEKKAINCILAGLEQAFWDIKGKILKKPLSVILTTKIKSENPIDLYASGGMIYDDQSYSLLLNEALEYKELGFKGYKFRPSISRKQLSHFKRTKNPPKFDVKKLMKGCAYLRLKLGDSFKLMIDTGCRINNDLDFRYISNCLDELNFLFLEEPFRRNIELYKRIKRFKKVQIAAGESLQDQKDFNIWAKKIDILQPDSNMIRISEILKLKTHLKKNTKKVIFHNWANPISMFSNFHLSKIFDSNFIEYNITYNPIIKNLLKEKIKIKKGQFVFDKKPGLGIEMNEDFLKKYSIKL